MSSYFVEFCQKILKIPWAAVILLFWLNVFSFGCTSNYQRIAVMPVAKVNEHILDVKEFSILLARELKDLDALAAKDSTNIKRVKDKILNNFVENSLMLDWAKKK